MPDARRRSCKVCGRHETECGAISWSGKCLECAWRLAVENMDGISQRKGYAYRRWATGMHVAAAKLLLDDAADGT